MHSQQHVKELTLRGMILGAILTIIFTASNVYLGLKVGLTFSTAIPAVVISIAVFKIFWKESNILEQNMVQTQVSAAGTLSSVIFVIPGLFMIGYWVEFPLWQTFLICFCGGCLGVIFTIPLRRAMVVESDLAYPEGRAAAEILKIADSNKRGSARKLGIREIALGSGISAFVCLLSSGFRALVAESSVGFVVGKAAFGLSFGYSLSLLGAGYLVGMAGAMALVVGMFLAFGVFTPYLTTFVEIGDANVLDVVFGVWAQKVRLIGTGTIAIAALWTLCELLGPVIKGMKTVIAQAKGNVVVNDAKDTDMSLKSMGIISLILIIMLFATFFSFMQESSLATQWQIIFAIVATIVAVLVGFFVAAACGYMAGLVGSSSSPISGIGLIGVIFASFVILLLGSQIDLFDDPVLTNFAIALAIFTTSVILATAAISNDNLQDLNTGFLVGATPWKQQVALLIGCLCGAIAISPVLNILYQAYGFIGAMPRPDMDPTQALAAPQANLMSTIAQGIFKNNIEWVYIQFGALVGLVIIIIDKLLRKKGMALPPLAVGIGIYLPASVNMALAIGGIMAYVVNKYLRKKKLSEEEYKLSQNRGTLFASGLIVGECLLGVIIACITVVSMTNSGNDAPLAIFGDYAFKEPLSLIVFVGVFLYFIKRVIKSN